MSKTAEHIAEFDGLEKAVRQQMKELVDRHMGDLIAGSYHPLSTAQKRQARQEFAKGLRLALVERLSRINRKPRNAR